jgi:DNA-binding transcriptional regulator YhcF (GntR family)
VGEFWANRTGRWRAAMRDQSAPTVAERLYFLIRADVDVGSLPAGVILPPEERVAQELAINAAEVRGVYARLVSEGVVRRRAQGAVFVPARDGEPTPDRGATTQIRFEAALLQAVREAAVQGLSSDEATVLFKSVLQRMHDVGQGSEQKDE